VLSDSEEIDLACFFAQTGMGSITGAAMENAALYHVDGSNHHWSWLPPVYDRDADVIRKTEATIICHETRSEPTDYLPNEAQMHVAGEVSRRLQAATAIYPHAGIILGLYYGPIGLNLASRSCGRIASLYAITEAAQSLKPKIKDFNQHSLGQECVLLACQGATGESRELLRVMGAQAGVFLRKAQRAYSGLVTKDE